MTKLEKMIIITFIAVIAAYAFAPFVEACETPTSDEELAEFYKICKGGWCLRD